MNKHKLTLIDHILIRIFYSRDKEIKTEGLIKPPPPCKPYGAEILPVWARKGLKTDPYEEVLKKWFKFLVITALIVTSILGFCYAFTLWSRDLFRIALIPVVSLLVQPLLHVLIRKTVKLLPTGKKLRVKFGVGGTFFAEGARIAQVRVRLVLASLAIIFWAVTWLTLVGVCENIDSNKEYTYRSQKKIGSRLNVVNSPFFGLPFKNLPQSYRITDRDLVRADSKMSNCKELKLQFADTVEVQVVGESGRTCYLPEEIVAVSPKNAALHFWNAEDEEFASITNSLEKILAGHLFITSSQSQMLLEECFQSLDPVAPFPNPLLQYRKGMILFWGLLPRSILLLIWVVLDMWKMSRLRKELKRSPYKEILERLNARPKSSGNTNPATDGGSTRIHPLPLPPTGEGSAILFFGGAATLPAVQDMEMFSNGKPFDWIQQGDASGSKVRNAFIEHCSARGAAYRTVFIAIRLSATPGVPVQELVRKVLPHAESVTLVLCKTEQFIDERGIGNADKRRDLWYEKLAQYGERVKWQEIK